MLAESIQNTGLMIFNVVFFILILGLSFLLILKIKNVNKNFKLLFVSYLIFWIPLVILHELTGVLQKTYLNNLKYLWIPVAMYGFIGIFARPFADFVSHRYKSHKLFIYLALGIQLITYIPVIVYPNTITNTIQSLGVGIGASCIGTYQLFLNEQSNVKGKTFLTISILSIPPLLANFISSPIVCILRSIKSSSEIEHDINIIKYAWVIAVALVVITFILVSFIKENKSLVFADNKYKYEIESKISWINFCLIALLGLLIMFVKFSNSGSLAILHIQEIAKIYDKSETSYYEGYLSSIFTIGQLVGGLLTGLILVNKMKKVFIFYIGCAIWLIYEILAMTIFNPYAYLSIHCLNGLAYGITYNLLLGVILNFYFKKTNRVTPMGVYQSILAVGITSSTWLVSWLKSIIATQEKIDPNFYRHFMLIINLIMICTIVLLMIIYLFMEKLNKNLLQWNKVKQNVQNNAKQNIIDKTNLN